MPRKTSSTLVATSFTKVITLDLREIKRCSIGAVYTAHASGANGKCEFYFKLIGKGRVSGAETDLDLGRECTLQAVAGKYSLNTNTSYETPTASTGASTDSLAVWDNRICDTIDAVEVYAKETGDATNRGTLTLNSSLT